MRFKNAVHAHEGTEEEKVNAAKQLYSKDTNLVGKLFYTVMVGGGAEGVLGTILSYV